MRDARPFLNAIHRSVERRYLVANRTDAVLYREGAAGSFGFLERLSNSAGRKPEGELASDRPGRVGSTGGRGTIRHALSDRRGRHEESARKFAARIARFLSRHRREQGYDELVIVAEPHFLGLLREALPKAVRETVRREIAREYAQGSDGEVRALIAKAIA